MNTSTRDEYRQRRAKIAAAVQNRPDDTYEVIGNEYGISRERVRQIAKQFGVERRRKPEPEK